MPDKAIQPPGSGPLKHHFLTSTVLLPGHDDEPDHGEGNGNTVEFAFVAIALIILVLAIALLVRSTRKPL